MKRVLYILKDVAVGCAFFLASSSVGIADEGSRIITDRFGNAIGSYQIQENYKDNLGREISTAVPNEDGTLTFTQPDKDSDRLAFNHYLTEDDRNSSDSRSSTVYRDRYGSRVASSSTDGKTGKTVIRDRYGKKIGTSTTDKSGKTTYRDRYGKKVATSTVNSSGQTIIRDRYGKKIGSSSKNSTGQTVIRDRYGNKIGTSTTDKNGKTIYRDKYGKKVGQSESKK